MIQIVFLGAVLGVIFGFWSFTQMVLTIVIVFGVSLLGIFLLGAIAVISALTMETHELQMLKERLYNRIPLLGGWLRRKTATALARLLKEKRAEVATLLAEAVTNTDDNKVRRIAAEALSQIDTQACINAVVAVWVETRHRALTNLLIDHRWVASAPINARVLSALKAGKSEILKNAGADVVVPLVEACQDDDPALAELASQLLPQLSQIEAKEALCQYVIDHEHPIALEAVLSTGYLPRNASQRALFLFMTEQWDRYEALDFDHALLSAAHRTASTELRRRIADKLKKAGRTDFLTVFVGADYRSHAAEMTPAENDVLVEMLSARREWDKLWKLVFELPFVWSIRIVQTLREQAWQPERGDERIIFKELGTLAAKDIVTSEETARQVLPRALQEATIRVNGRVNDVAFSPTHPMIAIGTGGRKVGLWNFQHGAMEQIWGDFDHSIGLVTFLPDGTLLCAERTNTVEEPCGIYVCRDEEIVRLGQHEGSVTAIEPINETQLLSTGRDERVILWDVNTNKKIKEEHTYSWARAAKVSPDGRYVALLHKGVTLLTIPELERHTAWSGGSMGRCAAFIPNQNDVVVGKYNGDVLMYEYTTQHVRIEHHALTHHTGRAEGVVVFPHDSILITAGSEGSLHFTNWANRQALGSVQGEGGNFTSLHISPDGVFMATGESDSQMSLWDLRVLDVPRLFTCPFAQASPDLVVTMRELIAKPKLKSNVRQSLKFIQKVLQYRFRFDIEIAEVPTIKVGEFDIEIE